jgi:hypothetical protein
MTIARLSSSAKGLLQYRRRLSHNITWRKRARHTPVILVGGLLALWLIGCGGHSSNSPTFAATTIRVIDQLTMQPVVGATVSPLCMGGTTYETNTYQTDSQGNTKIMFYRSSPGFVVKIEREGYAPAFLAASATSPVLSLKRAQR